MEDQPVPTPRKKPTKREQYVPLDALRLMLQTHAMPLAPISHQVKDLPIDSQLEYYFVPMHLSHHYKHYFRPGKPFRNLKLVNFDKPAISLSFFFKHKYAIQRTPDPSLVIHHLAQHRAALLDRSITNQLSAAQQQDLQQTDHILRTLRDDPEAYQVCFSNYYHYYKYWYCSYRYFEDDQQTLTANSSEHLLKHTQPAEDFSHERLNIIFIDPDYISRPVPNDNKRIDRELETYPLRIKEGLTTLFLRKAQP